MKPLIGVIGFALFVIGLTSPAFAQVKAIKLTCNIPGIRTDGGRSVPITLITDADIPSRSFLNQNGDFYKDGRREEDQTKFLRIDSETVEWGWNADDGSTYRAKLDRRTGEYAGTIIFSPREPTRQVRRYSGGCDVDDGARKF